VIISGAVSPGEAINMARSAFERWKVEGKASLPSVAVVPAPPDTRVHLLDRPRATQTLVCALTTVMGREDPDAPAMEVAVHILAGAFDSRLQTAMREEGGYTYGVQSAIDWFHGSSRLSICAQVERGETVRAAQEILRQVEGMRSAPPDEAAVARALEGLRGSAAGHYETLGGSAAEAREAFLRAATWSAASSTEAGAAAPVSAARVAAVAERLLRADRIALLLVGDARRLRPVLGDLDRGVVIQTF
ncbi:MAG: insulinase family protein, partial [Myxococcales bacterium]|nr:insulinase family protein [Myxococcales bacterium]